jgi:dipeptidyl aminopeptidase/acylaminoacyl peptidase
MDFGSVEEHLVIDPRPEGEFSSAGTTLIFRPSGAWPSGGTVRIRLGAGSGSTGVLPVLRTFSTSFTVGFPRVAYLWPASGPSDLYLEGKEDADPERLTSTTLGVMGFAVGLGGAIVVYSEIREDEGSDLRLLDLLTREDRLLYACPPATRCQSASISPDGRWLAFERVELKAGAAGRLVPGQSRVWVISMTGETGAIPAGPEDHHTTLPDWSPSGLLAYYDNSLRAFALSQVGPGEAAFVVNLMPGELGVAGTWSPDGAFLVYPDMVFPEEGQAQPEAGIFYTHLFQAGARSGFPVDISPRSSAPAEDASPAFSPDGKWIAFARKYLSGEAWTLGRQIWLMRSDGTSARALTDTPQYNYSSLRWQPDSKALVYMRFDQDQIGEPAQIWVMDTATGQATLVVEGGYLPQWIP